MLITKRLARYICFLSALVGVIQAAPPLVYRHTDWPAEAGSVFLSEDGLAGTKKGLFRASDGKWMQILAGKEVLSCGLILEKTWAAGPGYVALGQNIIPVDDYLFSGLVFQKKLFISGLKGVWLVSGNEVVLVKSVDQTERIRLFESDNLLYLFTDAGSFIWKGAAFEPFEPSFVAKNTWFIGCLPSSPQKCYFSHDLSLRVGSIENYVIVSNPEFVATLKRRGLVGFYATNEFIVFASFSEGLFCIDYRGKILWKLDLKTIGGNIFSLVKTDYGFMVGTTTGVASVYSNFYTSLPLVGERAMSVDSSFVRGYSGSYDIESGEYDPSASFCSNFGAEGRTGAVILPGGKVVRIGGRIVFYVSTFLDGWVAVQESGLVFISREGAVTSRISAAGAESACVDGDSIWLGTSFGLLRFTHGAVTQVFAGSPIKVAESSQGPVFIAGSEVRFPDGDSIKLPGPVLAVAGDFAAVLTETGVFVGSFRRGWKPLDTPKLDVNVSHLIVKKDYIYVVSPEEVFRITRSGHPALYLPQDSQRNLDCLEADFEGTLPPKRFGPWPDPIVEVRVDGQIIALKTTGYIVPRLAYGTTRIEVVQKNAGLKSTETIFVSRLRPWWVNWQGGLLYAVATFGTIATTVSWRTRRLMRQTAQLKTVVAERTEELRFAMKARENFFEVLSHEIRNPLNGVVGLCEILNEPTIEKDQSKQRRMIKLLTECAAQLRSTVDDVLDFSRIDRGQLDIRAEDFNYQLVIEGAVEAIDPGARFTRIKNLSQAHWLRADSGKIRQIISNLVSNALKYGEPKGAEVTTEVAPVTEGTFHLVIKVANQGATLDRKELQEILAGHGRGLAARRSSVGGSGIGLAVSKRLAEAMGGSVEAESANGVTTFTLNLECPAGGPVLPSVVPIASRRLERLLVVEDESYNRWVMGHYLAKLGFSCDWAVDGESALKAIEETSYDIVLTDLMLPDMEGTEIARRVLAGKKDGGPRFIAVTAFSTPEKMAAALAVGIEAVLPKPVKLDQLQSVIDRLPSLPAETGKLEIGPEKRREIVAAIVAEWALIRSNSDDLPGTARAVHKLRSKVLLIEAPELDQVLAKIEIAATRGDREATLAECSSVAAQLKKVT